jgi:catechol 2,3-dioxygenase-like lactoylglutathione lyase family enzyme
MTQIDGLSHLMLTVRDANAAAAFWCDVMDFELAVQAPHLAIMVHHGLRVGIGCVVRDETADDFDERRVGLDHICFDVSSRQVLNEWAERLAAAGSRVSPIVESAWGWHLNFRAPDNIPIEFICAKEDVAEALYGHPGEVAQRVGQLPG